MTTSDVSSAQSAQSAQSVHGARSTKPARKGGGALSPFEWWLSFRYFRTTRREGFASIITILSVIGISLGVMTLITVMAVMNGFRADLIGRILGANGHVTVDNFGRPLAEYENRIQDILKVPGVTNAVPQVTGAVMVVKDGDFVPGFVRGMRLEDMQSLPLLADNIVAGKLADVTGSRNVAIGTRMAARFGLRVGDRITLVSPQSDVTPFGSAPRQKAYRVAALFQVGISEFDASFIQMPLEQAQIYFKTGTGVSQIEVRVEKPDVVERYRSGVSEAAGDDVRVYDWKQINGTLVGALQVERTMMFIIVGLIILVAALNIVSGLVMLVKDKTRDIAILRSMGATQGAVLRVFLISGSVIGIIGTSVGVTLGLLLSANIDAVRQGIQALTGANLFPAEIYFLNELTAQVNNGEVVSVVIFALSVSILAPLYPAYRAARTDPVEALRYE